MPSTPDDPTSPRGDDDSSDFERLLGGASPGSRSPDDAGADADRPSIASAGGVDGLIREALSDRSQLSDDVLADARRMIERLDRALAAQVVEILHHPEFQDLEATWRGLRSLVAEAEIGVQVRCVDVRRAEVAAFVGADGGWRGSPLHRRLVDDVFDTPGRPPFWVLISGHDFGPGDSLALDAIGRVAEAALCPFVAGAAPAIAGLRTWSELEDPMAKIAGPGADAAWHRLRAARHAAFLGLAAPRALARLPYGERTEPVDDLPFEEPTDEGDPRAFCWASAAFAAGAVACRAFVADGWCAGLGGRSLGDLPMFTLRVDDDRWLVRGPTEAPLSESRIAQLVAAGVIPLAATRDSERARLASTPSLAARTEPAAMTPRMLDDLFALVPFGLLLRCAARDAVTGAAPTADSVRARLEPMVLRYVLPDGIEPTEAATARHPLAAARLTVGQVPGRPGEFVADLRVAPWHLLQSRSPLLAASFLVRG